MNRLSGSCAVLALVVSTIGCAATTIDVTARCDHLHGKGHQAKAPRGATSKLATLKPGPLQLPAGPRCEETFDIVLYRQPGVGLVRWTDRRRGCRDRQPTIDYDPAMVSAATLRRVIRCAVTGPSGTAP